MINQQWQSVGKHNNMTSTPSDLGISRSPASNNAVPSVDAKVGSGHESRCITRKEHDRALSAVSTPRHPTRGRTHGEVLRFAHLSDRVSTLHATATDSSPCPSASGPPTFSVEYSIGNRTTAFDLTLSPASL